MENKKGVKQEKRTENLVKAVTRQKLFQIVPFQGLKVIREVLSLVSPQVLLRTDAKLAQNFSILLIFATKQLHCQVNSDYD